MNVDVLWVSRHYPEIIARGYADEGLLEAMLDRSLWHVPASVTYVHHEVLGDDWPEVPGAVVIVPARHHASEEDVEWLHERVAALDWCLLVLAGDEEWDFPSSRFPVSVNRKLWIMQPRPEHEGLGLLPGGWSPGTREGIAKYRDEAEARPLDWFFAGQVTHDRRRDCVLELRDLPNGKLVATKGYMQGIERDEYRRLVASSKVMPCPSGPYTVDTNRPLEAMEAGTVPIVDTRSPMGPRFDYWGLVFGDHPLRTVAEWFEVRAQMKEVLADWTFESNRVFAWWQGYKRDLCHRFERDVQALAGTPEPESPDDLVTVIVTTSPLESHPDTKIIEETIRSVRDQLPRAEILIACDGVRDEQQHLRDDYEDYLRRLLWIANHEWRNVLPLLMPEWGHQANSTRLALEHVTTPQLLFVEHDTPIFGDIDWDGLTGVIESGDAEMIRFHIYDEIHPEHKHMMLDHRTREVEGTRGPVPMRRHFQFWQRPHLASTKFYRDKVMPHFPPESRTMIEDKMHGVVHSNFIDFGRAGWFDYRLWVYCPEGGFKRSGHLDGRGEAPQFDMKYD